MEKLFLEIKKDNSNYGVIGTYWERGNKNEIDIVAINEIEGKIEIIEVKMNKEKINISKLKEKSKNLIMKFKEYDIEYDGLSLDDIDKML